MKRRTFLETVGGATAFSALRPLTAAAGFHSNPPHVEAMSSELRLHEGKVSLFLNGVPHDGIFCSMQSRYMQNFIDAGFDIFDARDIPHGWVDDGKYDFAQTDKAVEAFLRQKRSAKLIVRCGWFPRNFWWVLKHPEEAAVPHVRDKKQLMPSYASLRWREESAEALRKFVEHMEGKYGSSIIAYLPDSGEPGEWFERYAYTEDEDRLTKGFQMGDYSAPMQRAYRHFAQRRYGSIAEVNRIYRTEVQTMDQLSIPESDRRLTAKLGHLRSLADEQAVIDFYEVLNLQVCETLVHYAREVKEGCQRRKLVLAFYGYQWLEQPRGGVSQARAGHVHLDEVLSSPDIDVLVAPYHYDFRQTEGVMSSQAVVGGILRRGKQFVHECDGSTYLKTCWPCPDHNNPETPIESGRLLKRDLSRALLDGTFLWFMDLPGGMYDSPEMVAQLKNVIEVGRKIYWETGRSDRQAAVVLHSRDAFYQREGEPLRAPLIPQFKQHELECTGFDRDDLMLENLKYLKPEDTAQYKVWIFPSAVNLSDEEIALIRQHCCRNNNHVVWMYAPGVVGKTGLDCDRVEQVTGFKVGFTMEPGEVAVKLSQDSHPFLAGRKSPMIYGTYGEPSPDFIRYHSSLKHYPGSDVGFSITPRFYLENADTVLGSVLDMAGEPAGFGVKQMEGWTSIFSVAPLLPKHVLRNIANAAGCHVFTDFPGQTYHCQNYVGFFAHETGTCKIRFSARCRVTEVFAGTSMGDNVDEVEVPVKINDALLLHYVAAG